MAKSTKIIAALGVVAGLGVAAMPLASYAANGDMTVEDTIAVNVQATCGFSTETTDNAYATSSDGTWGSTATTTGNKVANTWTAGTFTGGAVKTSGAHTITVVCNNEGGWNVKATANALSGQDPLEHDIPYNTSAGAGSEGYYVAIASDVTGVINSTNVTDGKFNGTAGTIVASRQGVTKTAFTATYTVATTDDTPAGSYKGSVSYALTTGLGV